MILYLYERKGGEKFSQVDLERKRRGDTERGTDGERENLKEMQIKR